MISSNSYDASQDRPRLWPSGSAREHEVLVVTVRDDAPTDVVAFLRGTARVRTVRSLAAPDAPQQIDAPLAVLLDLDRGRELTDLPSITRSVTQFRALWTTTVPVVGYAPLTAEAMRLCVAAGQAGMETVLIRGIDNPSRLLGPVLERRSAEPLVQDILAGALEVGGNTSDDTLRMLRFSLEHVRDRVTVLQLAASLGVSARTVATYLAGARWPSPERFIMYTRLLVLAWLVRDPACSVNRAALMLGMDGASVRHLVARYMGRSADSLRGPDGLAEVVHAMRRLPPAAQLSTSSYSGSDTPLRAQSLPR